MPDSLTYCYMPYAGYMDDPLLLLSSRAWLNSKLTEAASKLLYERILDSIGDDEIDFFLSYLGRHVLYSVNPGTDYEQTMGPVHIPLLPADLIILLDSLNFGEVGILENGIEIRLDSIVTADSALIAKALALERTFALASRLLFPTSFIVFLILSSGVIMLFERK